LAVSTATVASRRGAYLCALRQVIVRARSAWPQRLRGASRGRCVQKVALDPKL